MENVLIKNENNHMGENEKEVIKKYYENLSQKTEEYLEFISFLLEQEEWDREVIIIKQSDWDEFYNTDDEDYEMKITAYVQASEFYDKFAEITGTDECKFESSFVSSKYIDTYTYNTMSLIVNIEGNIERFIIDCV